MQKPVNLFDISCLHDGDRLKAAVVFCFYKAFAVNNSLLLVLFIAITFWLRNI